MMEEQKKTFSLLSLIFGIAAFPVMFIPGISFAGIILAILGLIFSSVAKKKEGKNGMNKAGFILSLIALILFIIVVVIVGLLIGATMMMFAAL